MGVGMSNDLPDMIQFDDGTGKYDYCLRDQFFCAALAGLLASPLRYSTNRDLVIETAWLTADEALKQRGQK